MTIYDLAGYLGSGVEIEYVGDDGSPGAVRCRIIGFGRPGSGGKCTWIEAVDSDDARIAIEAHRVKSIRHWAPMQLAEKAYPLKRR